MHRAPTVGLAAPASPFGEAGDVSRVCAHVGSDGLPPPIRGRGHRVARDEAVLDGSEQVARRVDGAEPGRDHATRGGVVVRVVSVKNRAIVVFVFHTRLGIAGGGTRPFSAEPGLGRREGERAAKESERRAAPLVAV